VIADDAYLRESILDPGAKIVAGFPNVMPSFRGVASEQDVLLLIAYIKSLGTPALAGPGAGVGAGQGSGAAGGISAPGEAAQRGLQNMSAPEENPHTMQSGRAREVERREGGTLREK
jgi:hypothetical protein